MTIKVALHHRTRYEYDRPVSLSPHEVRLRPAAHARTPIESYSLKVSPAKHFLNWQQDPYGNWVARIVFPEKARALEITVDLVADMTVINPFDFFLDPAAETFPFAYTPENARELSPYLEADPAGPRLTAWIERARAEALAEPRPTIDFLIELNRRVRADVNYRIRMEPGIQDPEDTLARADGSCRDSAWLLVQVLRHFGIAARFASGYLVQLAPDQKPLDGPAGPDRDFTDLHAWCEAYLPGAGWVGLDATSGLLAGEGHIPLACTALPGSAAPVTGLTEVADSTLAFEMSVTRIHEDPRVTRPFDEAQWEAIDALARQVDRELADGDVRLTVGGEPTFISVDDVEGPEWNFTAHSERKLELATQLLLRLRERFAPGGLLHFGQGKWYPGEALPRWALSCFWRTDGTPLWKAPLAESAADAPSAERFARALTTALGLEASFLLEAHEDPLRRLAQTPQAAAEILANPGPPAGYVLPLEPLPRATAGAPARWRSMPWPLKRGRLFLVAGDSALGYRLPLESLPPVPPEGEDDPVVRTALAVEPRAGRLHVFLPPVEEHEDFVALVAAVESVARDTGLVPRLEGYPPPADPRIARFAVTPDPGVIEVNIHPAADWEELKHHIATLYEEARACRLATEKFMLDGRHTGTGGGNHVTLGGPSPADSPLLRRPDLLRSLVTYWQNHPALSYLFSGLFIGPTSQSPRVDEARSDTLYELEIAFEQLESRFPVAQPNERPWLVDRILRNFLVDLTGNTHRAEFSIDKLYAPGTATGRLGLLEFRAFEMPPHPRMALLQVLLLRALVARFWASPRRTRLIGWGTRLHDEFMLPHFVTQDLREVVEDLRAAGYDFRLEWFAPFVEFRFPRYGTVAHEGMELELRQAIEPWHVLGEQVAQAGMSRYVDSSVERLQVKVTRFNGERYAVACNGRRVPMTPTGREGEFVAGVRYRAWAPPMALHPTIGIHAPLVFDIVDTWNGRSIGGCTYHVAHPGGRTYTTFPVNALEAEARRMARFQAMGHTPGPMALAPEGRNPRFPVTLDLRRAPEPPG